MRAARSAFRHRDPIVALALGAGMIVEAWLQAPAPPDEATTPIGPAARALALVAALALSIALAWRRRAPIAVVVAAVGASLAAIGDALDGPISLIAALVLAGYTAGAETRGRTAAVAAAGVACLAVATAARPMAPVEEPADVAAVVLLIGGPWLAGVAIRARREQEAVLALRARELEQSRAAEAAAAVAEERVRIARELHDVVGHAVAVIVLQARGARRALGEDPDAAREALDAIESSGTGALDEMRRLIGMIRSEDEAASLGPQPGLGSLDALVSQVAEAGVAVDVRIEGRPVELPAGIDLAAYRIVQEALTNTLSHAGAARASVVVRYGPSSLELEVVDTGTGVPVAPTEGHGLVGMRERVRLYGGQIDVGPRPDGGFAVRARLPISGVP